MIDWLLCVLIASFFANYRTDPWAAQLVLLVEYAFFIGLFAQTPGMRLTGLRCVSVTTNGPVGIPRAALRGLLLNLVIPALVVDRHLRGWHDKAAGTVVIRAAKRQDRN